MEKKPRKNSKAARLLLEAELKQQQESSEGKQKPDETNPEDEDDSTPASKKQRRSKYDLYDDIEEMMVGFGDNYPPIPESVKIVESMVAKYIKSICYKAQEISKVNNKLDKDCFKYIVRKDRAKYTRIENLLKSNELVKQARKQQLNSEDIPPSTSSNQH